MLRGLTVSVLPATASRDVVASCLRLDEAEFTSAAEDDERSAASLRKQGFGQDAGEQDRNAKIDRLAASAIESQISQLPAKLKMNEALALFTSRVKDGAGIPPFEPAATENCIK
jgi:hypothetical protein